jgi:hypothetical protein
MNSHTPLLAYFGHHKAASSWIRDIVQEVSRELGLRCVYVHHPRQFEAGLKEFVEQKQVDFLIHANANIEHLTDVLGCLRGFHVIRDPRDVAVSAYFSHLHSHTTDDFPRLVNHREKLKSATKDEGLLLEFEFRREGYGAMSNWNYCQPNVLELKMEEMVLAPAPNFARIFAFLGLVEGDSNSAATYRNPDLPKLALHKLAEFVARNDFTRKADGRRPGEEEVTSHYRKGVPGDWKNHFTQEHKDYFKKNFNDVLVKLGYEKDENW